MKTPLIEKMVSNEEWEAIHGTITTVGREVMDLPLPNFLGRIQEATTVGPLKDPFIFQDGEEYLFLLTACARDLDRFRQSCYKLLEHVIDRRQTDAVKIMGKSKLRDDGERISIQEEGEYKLDDNDLAFP